MRWGEDVIDLLDQPGQPFNKTVRPKKKGAFSICATVLDISNCMNATVE
jgi:hypothetical protein